MLKLKVIKSFSKSNHSNVMGSHRLRIIKISRFQGALISQRLQGVPDPNHAASLLCLTRPYIGLGEGGCLFVCSTKEGVAQFQKSNQSAKGNCRSTDTRACGQHKCYSSLSVVCPCQGTLFMFPGKLWYLLIKSNSSDVALLFSSIFYCFKELTKL